ncbi:MAG: FxsA family protein, partial [Candidatus Latescibacteria bacterium]|nr:FxsA family protein [Candidatus Latescibacterota bacterium]
MLLRLFLLFTLVPVIELALLVEVGSRIGVAPTIAVVLFTGAAGAWLSRTQGLRALMRLQDALRSAQ